MSMVHLVTGVLLGMILAGNSTHTNTATTIMYK